METEKKGGNMITWILPFFFLFAFTIALAGCGPSKTGIVEGKVNVVASFFPLYDFTAKIGGERVNVIHLVTPGADPHDWHPKTRDMVLMNEAQMFVYNGLGFEGWVEPFLENLDDASALQVVEASQGVEPIWLDSDAGEHHDGHRHLGGADPHVWLSPKQALVLAENIKNGLVAADPEYRSHYEKNHEKLRESLQKLHEDYEKATKNAPRNDIVVSHSAFAYLARDYQLRQVALMGLTPEAEPTPQQMKKIIDYIKKHRVKYVLFEQSAPSHLARILAEEGKARTAVFHSLETLTKEQLEKGEDYISLMRENLKVLEKALQK